MLYKLTFWVKPFDWFITNGIFFFFYCLCFLNVNNTPFYVVQKIEMKDKAYQENFLVSITTYYILNQLLTTTYYLLFNYVIIPTQFNLSYYLSQLNLLPTYLPTYLFIMFKHDFHDHSYEYTFQ